MKEFVCQTEQKNTNLFSVLQEHMDKVSNRGSIRPWAVIFFVGSGGILLILVGFPTMQRGHANEGSADWLMFDSGQERL